MLLAVLGIVAGLALLTYAADQFVVGAARIATSLRLSAVVVGAVVIGFGTSTPELLVTAVAAGQGSANIAVGNVVGSNVANLTLVLGVAALLTPIAVRSPVLKREAPMSLFAVCLFGLLIQGGGLSWVEGSILVGALVLCLAVIIVASRRGDDTLSTEVEGYLAVRPSTKRESVRTVLGLVFTLAAAQIVVSSARTIGEELGLAEGFVGLTIVAIGTSLPELATAVQAARRAETDLIVGNLLGSNLFNAGAVGATAAFAGAGQQLDPSVTGLGVVLMIGLAVLATLFMVTGRRVVRWEGAALLVGYLAVLPFLA
jgi:cation:H+ antiporter